MYKPGDKVKPYGTDLVMEVRAVEHGWLLLDIGWISERNCEPVATPVPFNIGDRVEPATDGGVMAFQGARTGEIKITNDETQEVVVHAGGDNFRVPASAVRKIPPTDPADRFYAR